MHQLCKCEMVAESSVPTCSQELSEKCAISVKYVYLACKEVAKVALQRLGGYFGRVCLEITFGDMLLSGFGVDSVL